MIQPNYLYGNSAHLPYAAATVAAYAFSDPVVVENYCLKKIQFLREEPDLCARVAQEPFLVGFSAYMWNFEYNLVLAERFKKHHPDCTIVFGGHQVTPDGALLDKYPFIDILVLGEGEVPFKNILLSRLGKFPLASVNNICFRDDEGKIVSTPVEFYSDCNYPSPYLEGYFDSFFEDYPSLGFELMLETNRGCAYNCSYCDWGNLSSKIRQFPLERVLGELDWASRHKLEFAGCADANFGILPRDEEIIDYIINLRKTTGYPQKFQASYAKNNSERIFRIGKKLNDNHMNKGVTLAFQTLSPLAAENVRRTNISMGHYSKLLSMYNEAKIPTYTELILGLPGETFESFAEGLNQLIKAGQHHSVYVHNCELLPGSVMGSKEYVEKYEIGASRIPLNLPHMAAPSDTEIPEFSYIVTKTYTMDHDMWIKTNMLSNVVQCFHHMNLLQFFSIFLFYENNLEYIDFYKALLDFIENNPNTVCGSVFSEIKTQLKGILQGEGSLLFYDNNFGDISWPYEEYAFLRIVRELDKFYKDVIPFLESFDIEKDIFQDLLSYQSKIIKTPKPGNFSFELKYNLNDYFSAAFKGLKPRLKLQPNVLEITDDRTQSNWADYARYIVWYGRKDSKNIHMDNVKVRKI
jgi:putative methyltransferase